MGEAIFSSYASVAQSVEQWTENPRVVGSIPTGGTTVPKRNRDAGVAHPVERHLAKVGFKCRIISVFHHTSEYDSHIQ